MMMVKIDDNNYPIPMLIGIRYITAYKASNKASWVRDLPRATYPGDG